MSTPNSEQPPMPPITPEMREAARQRAGGYLYVIDSAFDPNGDVPAHAIKGAFAVDEAGEIRDFHANPEYRPSPIELGEPPAGLVDHAMREAMSGRLDQAEFLSFVAGRVLPVFVSADGNLMVLDAQDGRCLVAYTAPDVAPEDVHTTPMYLPRLLRKLPMDLSVVLTGSAGLQARFPVPDLVAVLREDQLLLDGPTGELEVGPPAWGEQSARLAELVDEATFTTVEQALAEWGGLGKITPGRARAIETGIIAVEVLLRGGVTDPDVLAATAALRGVDPWYAGLRSKATKLPTGGAQVPKLLRSAVSPVLPHDLAAERQKPFYATYLSHLRAMPWQVRAVVVANRIADAIVPGVPDDRRESLRRELAGPMLSCAKDLPEGLRAQVADLTGADPMGPERVNLTSQSQPVITSAAQAVDRVRTVVGGLPDPVGADDIGLAYLVRAGSDVYFVHKVWGTVGSGYDIDDYRAEYDLFPLEPVEPVRESTQQPVAGRADPHERFVGSMLAGAMGDALGYAIEFHDIGAIRQNHGDAGLTGPVLRDGVARISDDTQMMLFTLEGLIRAHVARRIEPTDNDPVPEVQHAYLRWFHTQNQPWERAGGPYVQHLQQPDGWLITHRELFSARAPGSTCMSALANFAQTHQHATPEFKINDSKGCGGVMRAAPVAVWSNDPAEVFWTAARTAALTHSHPSGYLSAGVLAVIVHQLIRDVSLPESVRMARDLLIRWRDHEEQLQILDAAVELAKKGVVTPEELKDTLGQGWVGEEALAIGLYAVLATDNLRDALLLSVNHSGDSDSTGIVCGNIAGALYGVRAIPPEWLATLELRELVETLAKDALVEFSPGPPTDQDWTRRYPAW